MYSSISDGKINYILRVLWKTTAKQVMALLVGGTMLHCLCGVQVHPVFLLCTLHGTHHQSRCVRLEFRVWLLTKHKLEHTSGLFVQLNLLNHHRAGGGST